MGKPGKKVAYSIGDCNIIKNKIIVSKLITNLISCLRRLFSLSLLLEFTLLLTLKIAPIKRLAKEIIIINGTKTQLTISI